MLPSRGVLDWVLMNQQKFPRTDDEKTILAGRTVDTESH